LREKGRAKRKRGEKRKKKKEDSGFYAEALIGLMTQNSNPCFFSQRRAGDEKRSSSCYLASSWTNRAECQHVDDHRIIVNCPAVQLKS